MEQWRLIGVHCHFHKSSILASRDFSERTKALVVRLQHVLYKLLMVAIRINCRNATNILDVFPTSPALHSTRYLLRLSGARASIDDLAEQISSVKRKMSERKKTAAVGRQKMKLSQ